MYEANKIAERIKKLAEMSDKTIKEVLKGMGHIYEK